MADDTAKLYSLNVKGLNSQLKRNLQRKELKTVRPDVVFLQETHLISQSDFKFLSALYGRIYASSFTKKKAGVAILLSDQCSFVPSDVCIDKLGRYIILHGLWHGQQTTICNLYAPNSRQITFFRKILTKLSKWSRST